MTFAALYSHSRALFALISPDEVIVAARLFTYFSKFGFGCDFIRRSFVYSESKHKNLIGQQELSGD